MAVLAGYTVAGSCQNIKKSKGLYWGGNVGTEGVGVELGYKLTRTVDVRSRITYMPGFKIPHRVEYKLPEPVADKTSTTYIMKGNIERLSGAFLVDWYPCEKNIGLTVGGMFGGETLVNVDGYNKYLHRLSQDGHSFCMEICDRIVDINSDGCIRWNMTTPFFRPYLGVSIGGYRHAGIGVSMDVGLQYQGKMDLNVLNENKKNPYRSDNSGVWIRNAFVVYPVLNLRIHGKIF